LPIRAIPLTGLWATPSANMKNERLFPRYDIEVVTRAETGYAAFLIDHDTGDSWIFDVDLTWKKIKRSNSVTKVRKSPRAAKREHKRRS
jgi:hypothetical protein